MIRTSRHVLAPVAALALLIAACTGSTTGSGGASSPVPVSPSAGPVGDCPVSPAPAGVLDGWDVGAQRPSVFPQVINPAGTVTCGGTRLMFSFLDDQNVPVASPSRAVDVRLYDLGVDAATAVASAAATFIWAIEPRVGVYVADVELPTAGSYGVEFVTTPAGGTAETIRTTLDVQPSAAVVSVGDEAPASDTPTLADVGGDIARISTDPEPVPAFYETSIGDAVAAGDPFVVAFATPKFCVTQQCGPTLDRLKPIAARHPGVTVVNVEPYLLEEVDGTLQPVLTNGQLTPAPATTEWGLPTEPWVFVVDREGIVTRSFMLIFSDEELEAALGEVE